MNLPMRTGDAANFPDVWTGDLPETARFGLQHVLKLGLGLFAVMVLLAALVPIGGAVIGVGQVGVESRVKRIAHPFGGVIAQILVANGEQVKQGQLLLRLDDKVTGADAKYSGLTVEQLLAQRARLEAERLGSGAIAFPDELTKHPSASGQKAMSDEQQLFGMRRSEEGQMRAQLTARTAQLGSEIVSLRAQIASLEKQTALIEPERQGIKDLYEKDLVTISRLNQMERTAAEIEGRIASLNAQIAQTQSQITETQERAIQLGETRRVEAGTELSRVMAALNEQQVRSISAGDQQNRSEIRAPYAGTVEKIAFAAIGEVVRPAEPIMEIVPAADAMVVEVMLSPNDVDQVRRGQLARIRFSAFNRAATPEIAGKVTYVATDRSSDGEGKHTFYMVRVAIDQKQLAAEKLALRSGMPAEVHIETGDRSMLSYITKPLRDQFARAFRDN